MNTHSSLEILEARIAPAGVVTVAYNAGTGELTLTGDIDANQVNVFQTGVNTHRIEGLTTTVLNPGALGFLDIGKLTKLTIVAGDGSDTFTLNNLRTLTALSFDGGIGVDTLQANNLTVAGAVNVSGGDGSDFVSFDGLSTIISGDVNATDSADGINLSFSARKTAIGGSFIATGGTGSNSFNINGEAGVSVAKGARFTGSSGGMFVNFNSFDSVTLGKLPTGESILFTGGSGSNTVDIGEANATLAGGIRMVGGPVFNQITFDNDEGVVKIGKLATGQSIFFDSAGTSADTLQLEFSSLTLFGGIEYLAGEGTNSLSLTGPNGAAAVGKLATGQSIRAAGGAGDDTVAVNVATLVLAGALDFAGGDGINSVTLDGGNGRAAIGKLATGQSIRFTGGAGADTLSTTSAALNLIGGIEFTGGAGANAVSLAGANGILTLGKLATGHSIKYAGGADADTLTTDVSRFVATGGIEFAGGNGDNFIDFLGANGVVSLGKLPAGQSILYTGGSGLDEVRSDQARIITSGGVEFAGGDGSNEINFDNNGVVQLGMLATGQSVKYSGGSGEDDILLGGRLLTTKGSVEMLGGNGDNEIDLDGGAALFGKSPAGISVLLTGGTGEDTIDFADNIFLAGSLTLDGGAGDDEMDLDAVDLLKVVGAVTFLGGADDDDFDLNANALALVSTLTVTGGDGTDTARIVAEGTITGDVIFDLGGATTGNQFATITSKFGLPGALTLKGAFTVTGTGAAASTDALTLTNVAILKVITASLGAGVSTVTIDNLRAGDTFTLNTNDGADIVAIERGNFVGNSTIAKLASILAGTGDDQVLIGSALPAPNGGLADSTRVRFLGGLTVDGGSLLNDTRNDIAGENDFPGGAPTITGFEVTVA